MKQDEPVTHIPLAVTDSLSLKVEVDATLRVPHIPTAPHSVEVPWTARLFVKQELPAIQEPFAVTQSLLLSVVMPKTLRVEQAPTAPQIVVAP